jgi:hypothetical protein
MALAWMFQSSHLAHDKSTGGSVYTGPWRMANS